MLKDEEKKDYEQIVDCVYGVFKVYIEQVSQYANTEFLSNEVLLSSKICIIPALARIK